MAKTVQNGRKWRHLSLLLFCIILILRIFVKLTKDRSRIFSSRIQGILACIDSPFPECVPIPHMPRIHSALLSAKERGYNGRLWRIRKCVVTGCGGCCSFAA